MSNRFYSRYWGPIVVLAIATGLGWFLLHLPDPYTSQDFTNIAMIYLVATVFSAVSWGLVQSLATAFGGFLLYHILFNTTDNILGLDTPHSIISLLVFIAASLIAALFGSRTRQKLEKERLQNALHKERKEKEHEELRSALLASVTHDLKTPLASVIGSLSSIRHVGSLDDEARTKLIITAHEEAIRLNDFISNILNMTKLESGSIEPEQDWHYPVAIIRRVMKILQARIGRRKVIINEPPYDTQFYLDSQLTEHAIQNLLDNAVKYGAQDIPITIDISIDNNQGVITITNGGDGIPEECRNNIFNKFYRPSKRDSSVAGTGLGLAICHAIMQMHNGNIVFSEAFPDKEEPGTCFTLAFPKGRRVPATAHQITKEARYA